MLRLWAFSFLLWCISCQKWPAVAVGTAKGFTPIEQVANAVDKFPAEQFKKQGVPIEEIAEHVHFRQPEWNDNGFHASIGKYIDKNKFVTQQIKGKVVIFRKRTASYREKGDILKYSEDVNW